VAPLSYPSCRQGDPRPSGFPFQYAKARSAKPGGRGRILRRKITQAIKTSAILNSDHNGGGSAVMRVPWLRDYEGPNIGDAIPCQAAEGFLTVPERDTPDGQLKAPGLYDCPGPAKGFMTIHADG